MPQLVPFFFTNEVIFSFIFIILLIYLYSKYLLPRFVRLFFTRIFIGRL